MSTLDNKCTVSIYRYDKSLVIRQIKLMGSYRIKNRLMNQSADSIIKVIAIVKIKEQIYSASILHRHFDNLYWIELLTLPT